MKQNIFGVEIRSFCDLSDDTRTMDVCRILLQEVWKALGIEEREKVTERILTTICCARDLNDWAREMHQFIAPLVNADERKEHWNDRAERISSWFHPHLRSPVLEFGCDDGVVGKAISLRGYSVTLSDVFEHENIGSLNLPFFLFNERTELPLPEGSFKTVVLSSVLHHCNDPADTIREAKRLLDGNGSLLVSESVYGLTSDDLLKAPGRLCIERFAELTPEQQLEVNVFFEIIYHRILNFREREEEMIHLPCNYLPAKVWPEWFKKQGLETIKWWPIGISHKIGPLCHAVYILKKSQEGK